MNEHFDGIAEWRRPDGGYFFWLRFDAYYAIVVLIDPANNKLGKSALPKRIGTEVLMSCGV